MRTNSVGVLGLFLIACSAIAATAVGGPAGPSAPPKAPARSSGTPVATSRPLEANRKAVAQKYAALPLAFEPNMGQAPKGFDFVSRAANYTVLECKASTGRNHSAWYDRGDSLSR
jgi:hypothetical protein